ncbi:hypothetical protein V2647_06325 [Tenacibaculum maritimum]|uniref:hypothetical protein n=1 Tax=Tenacibaculum maritimum TaxID=107401 RepID=UPI001E294AF0|nr:hypothetical protein [Tenacibaculum maritimum]MCD9611433.1 hypothetical protein [Tenacibaculum maritimum]
MKKSFIYLLFLMLISCHSYGQLEVLASLPKVLKEVSGLTKVNGSDWLWMHNDSGNRSIIYGVNIEGEIMEEMDINAKNNDWEDMTSDPYGNVYIADIGNNKNKRKDLAILKISHQDFIEKERVDVERITFTYPDQVKFPPPKKQRLFDAESILYANGNIYLFTKSRVKGHFGKTNLYKVPAKKGNYKAAFISTFETCSNFGCWITSAAISPDGKTVALLNERAVLIFTDFFEDDFFSGQVRNIPLGFLSQKEGVAFKDNKTLYITDEKSRGKGGKLYQLSLH